jgi:hypothetical protein
MNFEGDAAGFCSLIVGLLDLMRVNQPGMCLYSCLFFTLVMRDVARRQFLGVKQKSLFLLNKNRLFNLENGGAEGSRTLDLRIANASLSQLSYRPFFSGGRT